MDEWFLVEDTPQLQAENLFPLIEDIEPISPFCRGVNDGIYVTASYSTSVSRFFEYNFGAKVSKLILSKKLLWCT